MKVIITYLPRLIALAGVLATMSLATAGNIDLQDAEFSNGADQGVGTVLTLHTQSSEDTNAWHVLYTPRKVLQLEYRVSHLNLSVQWKSSSLSRVSISIDVGFGQTK